MPIIGFRSREIRETILENKFSRGNYNIMGTFEFCHKKMAAGKVASVKNAHTASCCRTKSGDGCAFKTMQEENPQETLLSDLNLGLSLGSIYDHNFEERPFTRSFTGLITLNRDTVELGSMLSLEMSGSIPSKGEHEQGRKSRRGIAGEEMSPEVTLRMVASAEKNPALHRALARIKAAEECKI